jgi:exosortase
MLRFTAFLLWNSEDMAHGFVAPFVAVYLIWMRKDELQQAIESYSGSWWPLPLLAVSGLAAIVCQLAGSTTLVRFAFMGSLLAAVALLGGWPLLRMLVFPIALLLFCFPIPGVLYGEITQPLQMLAALLSQGLFEMLGYSVLREGNILELPNQRLNVAEACSGIRSLLTLTFAALVYSYFFEAVWWRRVLLTLSAVPAAILVNMLRITLTGILSHNDPEWLHGTKHDLMGWMGLVTGFLIVYSLHQLMERIGKVRQPVAA